MATISKGGTNLGEGLECKGSIPSFFSGDSAEYLPGKYYTQSGELVTDQALIDRYLELFNNPPDIKINIIQA